MSRLFSSLLPFENPLGFGASDFLELWLAAFLVFFVLVRPAAERALRALGKRTAWCMILLAILPLALRLLLLPHHPAPSPESPQGFAHLLTADTIRHFRLANPPHPSPQFFETLGVVQSPSYSSIDPLGQGLPLAFGRAFFGHPWAGVLCSMAVFCSLCYWMLRGWTTPDWALVGALLVVFQFGPLNQWTNSYAGGAAAAAAACLVFGALPRLRAGGGRWEAVLLGLGISAHFLILPYGSAFLMLSAMLFLLPALRNQDERSKLLRVAPVVLVPVLLSLLLLLCQNNAVTGRWTTTPAALSRFEYGAPVALTFEPVQLPHRALTLQQQRFREMQISLRGSNSESVASYLSRLEYRVRWYRFFLFAPLYLAVLAFIVTVREFPDVWLLMTAALFALGANFEVDFDLASIAAIAPLLIVITVKGLQRLSAFRIRGLPIGREAARLIACLCGVQFLFWYSLHLFETHETAEAMIRYETWDAINHDGPDRHTLIQRRLAQLSGRQLVFVHYSPAHRFLDEWVYNDADLGASRTIWARDLGFSENQKLQSYYPDRSVWLLDVDVNSPILSPYQPEPPTIPLPPEASQTERRAPKPKTNPSPFEPIP